jgi:ABC-2 type transport system ATP-binding protein
MTGSLDHGEPDQAAISVSQLAKTFTVWRRRGAVRRERTEVTAVAGVSFTVAKGEMLGYVGPNGAGKSTTIKMLTGVLVPTAGQVRVNGLVPALQRVPLARRIGVVFGQRSLLWWDLPLAESFRLLRHIYGVAPEAHAERLAECRELLELDELLTTPVRQLSLGQRMRGELTAALLHDPDILFLDEPTIGLDVVSKARVRTFLADINTRRGTTVLLTTHDLADIERLCSRLLIIDHGRVIYDGALETLRERYGTSRMLVVDFTEPIPPVELPPAVVVKVDGPRQWLRFRRDDLTASDLIARLVARYSVLDLTIEEPAVEDIVRNIYTGGIALGDSPPTGSPLGGALGASPPANSPPRAAGDQPASSP